MKARSKNPPEIDSRTVAAAQCGVLCVALLMRNTNIDARSGVRNMINAKVH
jgi:hypothetical protein